MVRILFLMNILIVSTITEARLRDVEAMCVLGARIRDDTLDGAELMQIGDYLDKKMYARSGGSTKKPKTPEEVASESENDKLKMSLEAIQAIGDDLVEAFTAIFSTDLVIYEKIHREIRDPNGTLIDLDDQERCWTVGAKEACAEILVKRIGKDIVIQYMPLDVKWVTLAEGVKYKKRVTFSNEILWIVVNQYTGEKLNDRLKSYGLTSELSCEDGGYHGEIWRTWEGQTITYEKCSYGNYIFDHVKCYDSSKYEPRGRICKPKRCGTQEHGTRKFESEGSCRSGRIQTTYKTCSYGDLEYSYESRSCSQGQVPAPGNGNCTGPLCTNPES